MADAGGVQSLDALLSSVQAFIALDGDSTWHDSYAAIVSDHLKGFVKAVDALISKSEDRLNACVSRTTTLNCSAASNPRDLQDGLNGYEGGKHILIKQLRGQLEAVATASKEDFDRLKIQTSEVYKIMEKAVQSRDRRELAVTILTACRVTKAIALSTGVFCGRVAIELLKSFCGEFISQCTMATKLDNEDPELTDQIAIVFRRYILMFTSFHESILGHLGEKSECAQKFYDTFGAITQIGDRLVITWYLILQKAEGSLEAWERDLGELERCVDDSKNVWCSFEKETEQLDSNDLGPDLTNYLVKSKIQNVIMREPPKLRGVDGAENGRQVRALELFPLSDQAVAKPGAQADTPYELDKIIEDSAKNASIAREVANQQSASNMENDASEQGREKRVDGDLASASSSSIDSESDGNGKLDKLKAFVGLGKSKSSELAESKTRGFFDSDGTVKFDPEEQGPADYEEDSSRGLPTGDEGNWLAILGLDNDDSTAKRRDSNDAFGVAEMQNAVHKLLDALGAAFAILDYCEDEEQDSQGRARPDSGFHHVEKIIDPIETAPVAKERWVDLDSIADLAEEVSLSFEKADKRTMGPGFNSVWEDKQDELAGTTGKMRKTDVNDEKAVRGCLTDLEGVCLALEDALGQVTGWHDKLRSTAEAIVSLPLAVKCLDEHPKLAARSNRVVHALATIFQWLLFKSFPTDPTLDDGKLAQTGANAESDLQVAELSSDLERRIASVLYCTAETFPAGIYVDIADATTNLKKHLPKFTDAICAGVHEFQTSKKELPPDDLDNFIANLRTLVEAVDPLFVECTIASMYEENARDASPVAAALMSAQRGLEAKKILKAGFGDDDSIENHRYEKVLSTTFTMRTIACGLTVYYDLQGAGKELALRFSRLISLLMIQDAYPDHKKDPEGVKKWMRMLFEDEDFFAGYEESDSDRQTTTDTRIERVARTLWKECGPSLSRITQLARSIAVGQRDEADGVALWKCLRQIPELAGNVKRNILESCQDEASMGTPPLSYHLQILANCVTAVLLGCREAGRESFDADFSSPCWFNNSPIMPVKSMPEAQVLNAAADRVRKTAEMSHIAAAFKQLPFICTIVEKLFVGLEDMPPDEELVECLRSLSAWLVSFVEALEEGGWKFGGLLKQVSMVMTVKTISDLATQFQKLTGTHAVVIHQCLGHPLETLVNAMCSVCDDVASNDSTAFPNLSGRPMQSPEESYIGAQRAFDDMAFKAKAFDGGSEVSITAEALVEVMGETLAAVEGLMSGSAGKSHASKSATPGYSAEGSLPDSVQEILALKAMFAEHVGRLASRSDTPLLTCTLEGTRDTVHSAGSELIRFADAEESSEQDFDAQVARDVPPALEQLARALNTGFGDCKLAGAVEQVSRDMTALRKFRVSSQGAASPTNRRSFFYDVEEAFRGLGTIGSDWDSKLDVDTGDLCLDDFPVAMATVMKSVVHSLDDCGDDDECKGNATGRRRLSTQVVIERMDPEGVAAVSSLQAIVPQIVKMATAVSSEAKCPLVENALSYDVAMLQSSTSEFGYLMKSDNEHGDDVNHWLSAVADCLRKLAHHYEMTIKDCHLARSLQPMVVDSNAYNLETAAAQDPQSQELAANARALNDTTGFLRNQADVGRVANECLDSINALLFDLDVYPQVSGSPDGKFDRVSGDLKTIDDASNRLSKAVEDLQTAAVGDEFDAMLADLAGNMERMEQPLKKLENARSIVADEYSEAALATITPDLKTVRDALTGAMVSISSLGQKDASGAKHARARSSSEPEGDSMDVKEIQEALQTLHLALRIIDPSSDVFSKYLAFVLLVEEFLAVFEILVATNANVQTDDKAQVQILTIQLQKLSREITESIEFIRECSEVIRAKPLPATGIRVCRPEDLRWSPAVESAVSGRLVELIVWALGGLRDHNAKSPSDRPSKSDRGLIPNYIPVEFLQREGSMTFSPTSIVAAYYAAQEVDCNDAVAQRAKSLADGVMLYLSVLALREHKADVESEDHKRAIGCLEEIQGKIASLAPAFERAIEKRLLTCSDPVLRGILTCSMDSLDWHVDELKYLTGLERSDNDQEFEQRLQVLKRCLRDIMKSLLTGVSAIADQCKSETKSKPQEREFVPETPELISTTTDLSDAIEGCMGILSSPKILSPEELKAETAKIAALVPAFVAQARSIAGSSLEPSSSMVASTIQVSDLAGRISGLVAVAADNEDDNKQLRDLCSCLKDLIDKLKQNMTPVEDKKEVSGAVTVEPIPQPQTEAQKAANEEMNIIQDTVRDMGEAAQDLKGNEEIGDTATEITAAVAAVVKSVGKKTETQLASVNRSQAHASATMAEHVPAVNIEDARGVGKLQFEKQADQEAVQATKHLSQLVSKLVKAAHRLAGDCTDKRLKTSLLVTTDRLPTLAQQLKVLVRVDAQAKRENTDTATMDENQKSLMNCLRRLTEAIKATIEECKIASIRTSFEVHAGENSVTLTSRK